MFGRKKIAMVAAEFIGVGTLSMAVYAMMARTSFPFFAALAAVMVQFLMIMVFGAVSGAHINPAVTLGLWTIRKIKTLDAIVYIIAQALGGLVAWRLSEYFIGQQLTDIAGKTFDWKVFVAEALGALIFTICVAAAVTRKLEGAMKAGAIALGLGVGILIASLASNGILNPAVALGVRSWQNWAYIAGPLAGSLLGMNLYVLLFSNDKTVLAALAGGKSGGAATRSTRSKPAARTRKKR